MKRILILLALVMLVFLVGCGSYDSAEYAETLIDLELSSEDYDPESTIRLSTERQGYELPDFFAFETELHSNPELVREVNEELVDLAPDPDELAALYYESLDGREGSPFDDLRDRPEIILDLLSSIEASYSSGDTFGFGELEGIFDDNDNEAFYFFSFAALLEDSRLFISAINEHEPTADDYVDYLDDYDINPRSATALGLILRRAYWEDKPDYVVEPLVLYLTELGFELVKPLNTPVPLEKYHELNLYAIEQILKGGLTSDEALSKALKRYEISAEALNEQKLWLNEHPEIQRASQRYLALALDEMTDEYKSEAGLTWHRLEMINEYSNSSAYGYSSNDIDAWHSIADNYNEYLEDLDWTVTLISTHYWSIMLDAYRMPRYEDDDHILPEWLKLDGRQEAGEIGEATEEAGELADVEAEGHYIEVWDGPMNLRDAPTLDSNVLTKVETGERMLFISEGPMDYQADTYAPWIKCRTMDGVTGYMFSYFTTYSDNTWSDAPVLEEAGALEEAAAEAMGY